MSVNDAFEGRRHKGLRKMSGFLFGLALIVMVVLFLICAVVSWIADSGRTLAPGMGPVLTAGYIAAGASILFGVIWSAFGSHR